MAPPPSTPAAATTISGSIYRIQTSLLSSPSTPSSLLLAAATVLSRPDYADIVVERTISSLCGYPSCSNPLVNPRSDQGKYRISLRDHRVYDLVEARKYCSDSCLVRSRAYEASLPVARNGDLDLSAVDGVLKLFEGKNFKNEGSQAVSDKLVIKEREPTNGAVRDSSVLDEEWRGHANAIEGYVPRHDRQRGSKADIKQEITQRTKQTEVHKKNTGASSIDEYDDNGILSCQTQGIAEAISKQLEGVALDEGKRERKKKANKHPVKMKALKRMERNQNFEMDFTSTIIVGNSTVPKESTPSHSTLSCSNMTIDAHNYPSASAESVVLNTAEDLEGSLQEKLTKSLNLETGHSTEEARKVPPKSILKASGSKNKHQSVRWVENSKSSVVNESLSPLSIENFDEDVENSLRLASAEACAAALTEAAELLSSGQSDAEDAVKKSGIIILPDEPSQAQFCAEDDADKDNNMDFDKGSVKWPKKSVLLDTDMFEVEDSWHDTPPDGFSLNLSAFARMWMPIFEWTTYSSLAYVYGVDESAIEELLLLHGREYSRKIILKDGLSAEIRRALDGGMCHALSGLTLELRSPIPVSTLERALGQLIDTMSFVEALPSLRWKQWRVLALVFLDVLSVRHLPALASLLADRSMLLQEVLKGSDLQREEYDALISHLLPFGRSLDQFEAVGKGITTARAKCIEA